jgi:hypothetical protein
VSSGASVAFNFLPTVRVESVVFLCDVSECEACCAVRLLDKERPFRSQFSCDGF